MTRTNSTIDFSTQSDLLRMVEPLASYICATDQPRAALASALAVLFKEVEETNRTALAHFGAYLEHC